MVKHSYLVMDAQDIPRMVKEAFYIAEQRPARPGGDRYSEGRSTRPAGPAADFRPADEPARLSPQCAKHHPEQIRQIIAAVNARAGPSCISAAA